MATPLPPRPAHTLTPFTSAVRHDIERWFVARGVPQLIEGYTTEQAMDRRAAPLIAGWLVLGTILHWGTRPDWPLPSNVAGIAATLAWMAFAYAVYTRLRGRRIRSRPQAFDLVDILALALLPTVPAGLIDGTINETIVSGLGALSGIGVVYVIVGFGLLEIGRWALGRLERQVAGIARLLASTLPLLLILVVFLVFAAELWEAVHALRAVELAAVLLLVLVVGSLLVVASFLAELRQMEERPDWDMVLPEAAGTPAALLIERVRHAGGTVPRLSLLQRINLTVLVLVNQLVPALFVAVTVAATLVVFGLLVLPASVLEGWIGAPLEVMVEFELLGEVRTVSTELLFVSALLSSIVALYFTGLALTDPAYRREYFGRATDEVRQVLAARAAYVTAIRLAEADADAGGGGPSGPPSLPPTALTVVGGPDPGGATAATGSLRTD